MLDKVKEFIAEGEEIRKVEYHDNFASGVIMLPYISGPRYDIWMNQIKVFATRHLKNHPLYKDILDTCNRRNNQWGTTAYDNMMGYLRTLENDDMSLISSEDEKRHPVENKKLFISHSSQDKEYVELIIKMLESIGFAGRGLVFCSSITGYNIPISENIYDYLKKQFDNELTVIMVLSDNYYQSAASLNEMGAAWITSKNHIALLISGFEFSQIKGAIDPLKIWIKMSDKDRLTELKDKLIKEFDLPDISNTSWEKIRDDFLNNVLALDNKYKYKSSKQKAELESIIEDKPDTVICIFRFINDGLAPVVCTKLKVEIDDISGRKAWIDLTYKDLKSHKIQGKERKRVIIEMPRHAIQQDDHFDFNSHGKWDILSFWSSYVD